MRSERGKRRRRAVNRVSAGRSFGPSDLQEVRETLAEVEERLSSGTLTGNDRKALEKARDRCAAALLRAEMQVWAEAIRQEMENR